MPAPTFSRRRLILSGLVAGPVLAAAPGVAANDYLQKGLDTLSRGLGGDGGGLSEVQIGKGLKEALRVASERVVSQVGQTGGYLNDAAIHIPLPGYLQQARRALDIAGAGGLLEELEVRLNRGAEAAAPEAKAIFFDAIGEMTLGDAETILNGPDDAATQYFKRTMTPPLKETFRPVMAEELNKTGAIATFDDTAAAYKDVPFVPPLAQNAKARLIDHGLDGALSGVFHYLAQEEAAIRNNPAKRTTDLLKSVFG